MIARGFLLELQLCLAVKHDSPGCTHLRIPLLERCAFLYSALFVKHSTS